MKKIDREIKHLDGKDGRRHKHCFKKPPARLIAMAPESQLAEQKEWPTSLKGEPEQSFIAGARSIRSSMK